MVMFLKLFKVVQVHFDWQTWYFVASTGILWSEECEVKSVIVECGADCEV